VYELRVSVNELRKFCDDDDDGAVLEESRKMLVARFAGRAGGVRITPITVCDYGAIATFFHLTLFFFKQTPARTPARTECVVVALSFRRNSLAKRSVGLVALID
jgi:hypothetical protein